jgi:hypothetical protein
MTAKRRRGAPDTVAMRFLLEQFIDVPEDAAASDEGIEVLQAQAARVFLPGPRKGAYSLQQLGLIGLRPPAFQELRRDVREWLRSLVIYSHVGHQRRMKAPLTFSLVSVSGKPDRLRPPIAEGLPLDVFWFYLVHLLSRAGLTRVGVCRAPKSKKDPGQQNPELSGETEPCERLFLRRGSAKEFCSERCRARVATQRARKGE